MKTPAALDTYLTRFEEFLSQRTNEPDWLTSLRKSGLERFRVLGFPTLRDEEWRFTPIAPIVDTAFVSARDADAKPGRKDIDRFMLPAVAGPRVVFVNGVFAPALSSAATLPKDAVVGARSALLDTQAGFVDRLFSRTAPADRTAFPMLNSAFTEDGALIFIPAGIALSEPIQILYYSTAPVPVASHPRTIVVAEANSSATIVESYAGSDGEVYFTNAVTSIVVGANAHVEHYRVQRESVTAYHLSNTCVHLDRSAVFAQQSFAFGGAIARHDIQARLDDEGIECTLNGLYLGNGDRLTDTHTVIDHAKPHCASHEIYKGMLDGRSRGVFNGKIFVRQDAQKTDAKQTNQVLLLSDDATINTKPQLEIFADDVKCTHGATVGQLDAEALFYLRSRGIAEREARAILVHAFASDIINRVSIETLRAQLEDVLTGYLPKTIIK